MRVRIISGEYKGKLGTITKRIPGGTHYMIRVEFIDKTTSMHESEFKRLSSPLPKGVVT